MAQTQSFIEKAKRRDEFTCQKCGFSPRDKSGVEGHHIHPVSEGGPDTVENIVTLCKTCHGYAPDGVTQVESDRYEEAFEIYASTVQPPILDIMMFGMIAVRDDLLTVEEFLVGNSTSDTPGKMDESNWWFVLAALAEYKHTPELLSGAR